MDPNDKFGRKSTEWFNDEISKECSAAIEELSRMENYNHVNLMAAYNDAYADGLRKKLVQAEEAYLAEKLRQELDVEKKKLGGTYYGWSQDWCKKVGNTSEAVYSALIATQNHQVPLNDPEYASEFFESLLDSVRVERQGQSSNRSRNTTRQEGSSSEGLSLVGTRVQYTREPLLVPRNQSINPHSGQVGSAPTTNSVDVRPSSQIRPNVAIQTPEEDCEVIHLESDDEDTLYSPTPRHNRSRSLLLSDSTLHPSRNISLTTIPRSTNYHSRNRNRYRNINRTSIYSSVPRKTRSQLKLEKELAEREAKLRAELANQFRANPVPASSIIPKYSEIMKSATTKAAEARAQRGAQLRSRVLPQNYLTWNEDESKLKRSSTQRQSNRNQDELSKTIQETLARISNESNAKEASTGKKPDSKKVPRVALTAADDGRKKRIAMLKNEAKAGLDDGHTFAPSINPNIPDFKKLHLDFEQKINSLKQSKSPIRPNPFPGLESHQKRMTERARRSVNEFGKPTFFVRKKFKSTSPAAIKFTKTYELKKQIVEERKKMQEQLRDQTEQGQLEKQLRQKKLAARIRSRLLETASMRQKESVQPLNNTFERDYMRTLHEIHRKLDERPLIFERESREKVKEIRNTVFDSILNEVGLGVEKFQLD